MDYMKHTIFICIVLLLKAAGLSAQSIRGTVTDEEGQPIEFANVILLKDTTFVSGTITNAQGAFTLETPPSAGNAIRITMVGYEDFRTALPPTGDVGKVTLRESSVMLGEVTVSAGLPATRLKGGTLVTTVENSVLSQLGTADDVLAHLPLVSGSEGDFTVFGRGTPQIYINGRLVRSTGELQRLSSENIKSVDVITNPGARYSAEVQSVIRIKTIPPRGEGFSMDLYDSFRVGHYARNSADFTFNYRHNGLEVFAEGYGYVGKTLNLNEAVMTTYGDDVLYQRLDARLVPHSKEVSGRVGFSYQFSEDHSIGAYYEVGRERDDVHTFYTSDVDLYEAGALASSETILSTWLSKTISVPDQEANVYYTGTVGKLDIDFNADFTQGRTTKDDDQQETNTERPEDNRHVISDGLTTSRLLAERLVLSHPVWNGSLEVGEEYTNSKLGYETFYTGAPIDDSQTHIRENNVAAFATLSQTFGPVSASVGLRYEHVNYDYIENGNLQGDQSKTYNNFFPTVSLSTAIGKTNWSLSFTSRTRRPSYRQLDGGLEYVNRFSYQSGNPKLQPVKMYTVQLMGMWKWLFAQAAVNHERNAIFMETTPYEDDLAVKVVSYANVPRYTQMQVAVGAQPTIGCWEPQATVGVMKQFYDATLRGGKLPLRKPVFTFALDNTLSLPQDWTLGLDLDFTTGGHMQNASMRPTNEINLMVRKAFLDGNLTVTLYGNDLLNASVSRTTMYSGDVVTSTFHEFEQRNVRLTLRYKFNTARSKYRGTGAGEAEKSRM